MKQVYLLTGRPGTGKTSIIKQVVAGFEGKASGFYTEEIREQGIRLGFKLITLDGVSTILAHIDIKSRYQVSKYGVDVGALEQVGIPALEKSSQEDDLIVIDEIGKMELFSIKFRDVVSHLIGSGKKILGTIMLKPHPWADAIKQRPEVHLITVTRENPSSVIGELQGWLKS